MSTRAILEAHSFAIGGDEYVVLTFRVLVVDDLGSYAGLTASERAVAKLVLQGRPNSEIARERGTSLQTVANQLGAVYQKLGVRSRRELAAQFRRPGTRR